MCCKKLSQKTINIIQPGIHLNRVSPLRQVYNFHQDHVDPGKAAELAQSAYELSNLSDPEIVAYFQQQKRFKDLALWRKKEVLKLGHLIQNQTYYIALTQAARRLQAKSSFHDLLRDPDPGIGDKRHVLIRCKRC